MQEKKMYIIYNESHDIDDYSNCECIENIYDSFEDAEKRMNKLIEFCKSQMNNNNWTYRYVLIEYPIPFDRLINTGKILMNCKNYEDE